jgi:predicted DsbA family dithiol-disulfide isomerase
VRLHLMSHEYEGRVALHTRFFALELLRGETAPRDILEQEWWLAAIQEPRALFAPYPAENWPSTTLPAFDAVWAARRQGDKLAMDYDLRIRTAFFGQGRNIGDPQVLREIAAEASLDMVRFDRDVGSPEARPAVIEESRVGREEFKVRGTPTLVLGDGTRVRLPFSHPTLRERKVVAVSPLPCVGEGCDAAIRAIFEQAIESAREKNT